MSWVSLLLTVISFVSGLVNYLREQKLISDAQAAVIAAEMQKRAEVIKDATAARQAQHDRNAAVPTTDSLPDDGFRRD